MWEQNSDGMPADEEKRFAVARGSRIAHTVGIETIEYGQALVWRGVRGRRIRRADDFEE
jgi:hypothetical protein